MKLFVMRHGQAEAFAATDAARPLTKDGVKEVTQMANWFIEQGYQASHLVVSPFIRAQQTASCFIEQARLSCKKDTTELLEPAAIPATSHDYIDALIALDKIEGLLIVSHMPLVSYLTSELTGGESAPLFQTAAIAVIDYDAEKQRGEIITLQCPAIA